MAIHGVCKLLAFYLVMSVSMTKLCFAGRVVLPLQAREQGLGHIDEDAVVVVGERKLAGNFEATSYPASKEHGVVCYANGGGGAGTSFAFGGGEHGSSSMGFGGANTWAAYDHHFGNGQASGFGYGFGGGSGHGGGFAGSHADGYAP